MKRPFREDGSKLIFIMTMPILLSTNVVVRLVSIYSHKHRMDYTTVHYMVHATWYTVQTEKSQMVHFLIAGHTDLGTVHACFLSLPKLCRALLDTS